MMNTMWLVAQDVAAVAIIVAGASALVALALFAIAYTWQSLLGWVTPFKVLLLATHIRLHGRVAVQRYLWDAIREEVEGSPCSTWYLVQKLRAWVPEAFDAGGEPIAPWAGLRDSAGIDAAPTEPESGIAAPLRGKR
jgi:hypothetical protein